MVNRNQKNHQRYLFFPKDAALGSIVERLNTL